MELLIPLGEVSTDIPMVVASIEYGVITGTIPLVDLEELEVLLVEPEVLAELAVKDKDITNLLLMDLVVHQVLLEVLDQAVVLEEQTLETEELEVHVDKAVLEVLVETVDHSVTLVETVIKVLQVEPERQEVLVQTETILTELVDRQDLAGRQELVVVLEAQPVTTFIIVPQLHSTITAQLPDNNYEIYN